MIKLSKEERKRMYLRVYNMLEELETYKDISEMSCINYRISEYCCDNLNFLLEIKYPSIYVQGRCIPSPQANELLFPEFYLFEIPGKMGWFGDPKEVFPVLDLEIQAIRKTALLLAAEMCN